MIRPVFTEIALFLAPFAAYAIFLFATRAQVFDRSSWSSRALTWLFGTALTLLIVSFFVFAHFSGAPPGATYEPARIEDGKFIPGRAK